MHEGNGRPAGLTEYAAACVLAAFGVVALWLGLRYLVPVLVPIAVGYGLSVWVRKMGHWAAAHTGGTGLGPVGERIGGMTLAALVCVVVLWGGYRGIAALAGQAGALVERAAGLWDWNALPVWIRERIPEGLQTQIAGGITLLVEKGAGWLAGAAGDVLAALPGAALAVFITAASAFYWLADREGIMRSVKEMVPERIRRWASGQPWWRQVTRSVRETGRSMGAYLKAQLSLAAVIFLVLTAGLSLLGIEGTAAWAMLTALADMLPLLGAGVILLPWAGFAFLTGETVRGVGIVVIWLAVWLLRQWLEPKLTGRALGVHPYVMLAGMYAAYRIGGVGGMVVGAVVLGGRGEVRDT
ncbi:MAG: AI-2E family transporter [Clostridia bacterium]|nr:AI-2E family transporter [Clostridia bacterium]